MNLRPLTACHLARGGRGEPTLYTPHPNARKTICGTDVWSTECASLLPVTGKRIAYWISFCRLNTATGSMEIHVIHLMCSGRLDLDAATGNIEIVILHFFFVR